MNRLALGTAQFGLSYGTSNKIGKVHELVVAEMLKIAKENNINILDTAISYGDSENILGKNNIDYFNVISKIPPLDNNNINIESWFNFQIEGSLKRLSQKSLYGILLHNPDDLFLPTGQKLYNSMIKSKKSGLVKNIGVSVHSPNQLEKIFLDYEFDIVQAPLNILDRRIYESGWVKKLNEMKVKIHTRSVFLQGLLLKNKETIPTKFKKWDSVWKHWEQYIKTNNINPIAACLSYPLSLKGVDKIIIGAQNSNQLNQIISASKIKINHKFPSIQVDDESLINPINWNNL